MTADDMQGVLTGPCLKQVYFSRSCQQASSCSDNGTQRVFKFFTEFLEEWENKYIRIAIKHPGTNKKLKVSTRQSSMRMFIVRKHVGAFMKLEPEII